MATSVDDHQSETSVHTARIGPSTDEQLNAAVGSALRSRHGGGSMRTAKPHSSASNASTASRAPSFDKMASAFASITVTYFLLAIQRYTDLLVSVFHLAYFSYRNPTVSKDLIKTAFHLLKTSYDNKLLTLSEIYQVSANSIIMPMARQNQAHFQEEQQKTAELTTMRTTAVSQ